MCDCLGFSGFSWRSGLLGLGVQEEAVYWEVCLWGLGRAGIKDGADGSFPGFLILV